MILSVVGHPAYAFRLHDLPSKGNVPWISTCDCRLTRNLLIGPCDFRMECRELLAQKRRVYGCALHFARVIVADNCK